MDKMKIEGLKPGKASKHDLARKQYNRWLYRTKESRVYKAILFALSEGECPKCGIDMFLSFNGDMNTKDNAATLDHTIPLAIVLEHRKYGMEIMCRKCNNKKGDKVEGGETKE